MYRTLILLILFTGILSGHAYPAMELEPFTTDGCSLFPDGTPVEPDLWLHCCVAHDREYWQGGTLYERFAADRRLKECVAKTGAEGVAIIMEYGTNFGGSPYFPSPFRWGYGWQYLRGYMPLSTEEEEMINLLQEKTGNTALEYIQNSKPQAAINQAEDG